MSDELLQAAKALLADIDGFNDQQVSINALRAAVKTAEWQEENTISLTWQIGDIQNRRPDLNDDQAREVLALIESEYDANIGVDWNIVDHWANFKYPEPDNLDELLDAIED